MPFITEEIWQRLRDRKEGESIMVAPLPRPGKYDAELVERVEKAKQTITTIRAIRKQQNIPLKKSLELLVRQVESEYDNRFGEVLKKLGNLSDIRFIDEKPEKALSFIVKTTEFYIPVGDDIDLNAERKKVENELEYMRGFLQSVMKKLNNRKFMENAPEKVVLAELNKKTDAEARIRALEEKLAGL